MAVLGGFALFVVVVVSPHWFMRSWLRRRQRPSLLERLQPYQPTSVAEEAQRWLEEQQN